jgi:hypothetical protein
MTGRRFDPSQVAVVFGGTPEIVEWTATRFDDLMSAEAIALHEPALEGSPWFVFAGEDFQRLLHLLYDAEATPGWLPRQLGAEPALVVLSPEQVSTGSAILLHGAEPAGVFAAEPIGYDVKDIGPNTRSVDPRWRTDAPSDDAPLAGEPFIRRTPHMAAPDQLPTATGASFEVRVWTDQAAPSELEESRDLLVEAPPDVDRVKVIVLLSASRHFDVGDDFAQPLTVERDRADSEPCVFTVTVADRDAKGDAGITARLQSRGRACGRVRREWSWPDGKARALGAGEDALAIHTRAAEPDLSVLITADVNDGINFTCSVRAPRLEGREGYSKPEPWALRASAQDMVSRWFGTLWASNQPPDKRRRDLRAAGRHAWNAAPKAFRKVLYELIAARDDEGPTGRATIYITSDEPALPWELMLPSAKQAGGGVKDRELPLGVEFAVGRWLKGDSTSPPQLLPVSDSVLLAPRYDSDVRRLDPSTEREVLEAHFPTEIPEPVSYAALDAWFAKHDASLLHFVCHGQVLADAQVLLLDDDEPCSADDVRDSAGLQRACGTRKPLVFINACDAGQQTVALGIGGGGFPRVFSDLGARAIIAPLWSVTKFNAPKVAKALYEAAVASPDEPLAAVLAGLRAKSYTDADFDDSWAAYCFYGDPCARLTFA